MSLVQLVSLCNHIYKFCSFVNYSDKCFICKHGGDNAPTVVMKLQLQTLQVGNPVSSSLIDAWCVILNHKEKFKSENSPARFFFKLQCCVSVYTSLCNLFLILFIFI